MLAVERQNFILEQIAFKNRVLTNDLCERLQISGDTIRRDLNKLANNGLLKKVHGGAVAASIGPYLVEESKNHCREIEIKIAKKVLNKITNGQVIIMGHGEVNLKLVEMLSPNLNICVITNSLPLATKLCLLPKVETNFIGGKVLTKNRITVGLDLINFLSDVNADFCLLEMKGMHPGTGITEADRNLAQAMKVIMNASKEVISLSTSEVLNTSLPFKIDDLDNINVLATELDPENEVLNFYKDKGIEVL